MDEDSSTEQKTWHVYSLGKRHVFRLHWNESREGFCTYLTYTLVFKRADRGRMADRNRASVPNNWSLVRQRTLTTGLCSEGWYSEHSGVCIILSEVTLCGWPIVKIRELTNCNTFVMRWPRAIDNIGIGLLLTPIPHAFRATSVYDGHGTLIQNKKRSGSNSIRFFLPRYHHAWHGAVMQWT